LGPRRLISTCNIAACIATSSPSSPGYYAPPLSTPLIPRRRHERSTPPPLPPSSMPSVFLDIKGGMPTVSQSLALSTMQKQTDRHGVVYSSTPNVAPLGARVGCDMNVSQKRNPYTTLIKFSRSWLVGRFTALLRGSNFKTGIFAQRFQSYWVSTFEVSGYPQISSTP